MPAKLFCKTGPLSGAQYEIADQITIGTGQDNDVVLFPKVISGKHARIYYEQDRRSYYIEDLKSRNGTQLDGVPITQGERLGKLHVITFAGAFDFIFLDQSQVAPKTEELSSSEAPVEKGPKVEQQTVFRDDFEVPPPLSDMELPEKKTPEPAEADRTVFDDNLVPPPDLPQQPDVPQKPGPTDRTIVDSDLTPVAGLPEVTPEDVSEPPKNPNDEVPTKPKVQPKLTYGELVVDKIDQSFNLKKGKNIVGRTIECDIYIDDPSVSRSHAVLECSETGITLDDLGSKNHTFLGGAQVKTVVALSDGSRITFGDVDAVLKIPES